MTGDPDPTLGHDQEEPDQDAVIALPAMDLRRHVLIRLAEGTGLAVPALAAMADAYQAALAAQQAEADAILATADDFARAICRDLAAALEPFGVTVTWNVEVTDG